jgi:SOS response regulatory protein OraA/RecX
MSITNKLYKYIFRKKVQREYDALLVEKNKIEAEITKLRENASESLEVLNSMHKQGLINDSDYAAKKNVILAML